VSAPADTTPSRLVRLKPATIVPVWLFALVAGVVVALTTTGDDHYTWLSLALGGSILLSFVLQLAASEKDGLVSRTMLALCGSLVILAATTGAIALVR
jgi:quinol-cytochrome oxidoreductase complex cytochrome b subunit